MTLKETLLKYSMKEWPERIPKPKSFPATLKDFLRMVVNTKSPSVREKRFRDYLQEEGFPSTYWEPRKPDPITRTDSKGRPSKYQPIETIVPEKAFDFKKPVTAGERKNFADEVFQKIEMTDERAGGFFTEVMWLDMAIQYKNWWEDKKSAKARQSALAKKPKKNP
jgi:hypothetical protein